MSTVKMALKLTFNWDTSGGGKHRLFCRALETVLDVVVQVKVQIVFMPLRFIIEQDPFSNQSYGRAASSPVAL